MASSMPLSAADRSASSSASLPVDSPEPSFSINVLAFCRVEMLFRNSAAYAYVTPRISLIVASALSMFFRTAASLLPMISAISR